MLSVLVSKVKRFLFVKSDTKIIIRSNNISNRLKVHIRWESRVNVWDSRYWSQRFSSHGPQGAMTADTRAMYYCVDNVQKKPGPGKDYYGYSYNEGPLLWSVGRDWAGDCETEIES